jgi:hypothetical protein
MMEKNVFNEITIAVNVLKCEARTGVNVLVVESGKFACCSFTAGEAGFFFTVV